MYADITIKDLLKGVNIIDAHGCEDIKISGVTADNRKIDKGFAFVAVSGTRFDGHDFIADTAAKGAICAIVERIPENCPIPCVVVDDTRRASSYIFSNAFGNPEKSMKIIGVTGTNGKTSSVFMLEKIFSDSGYKTGLLGTVKNMWCGKEREASLTTPVPEDLYEMFAEMRDEGVEYLFMEVSSHSLSLGRVAPIEFELGIYTNLTPEHLDFHIDMDSYAEVKEMLFKQSKIGLFSADNEYTLKASEKGLCKSYTFSIDNGADFKAENVDFLSVSGIKYTLVTDGRSFDIVSSVAGKFSVYNTMGAISAAYLLGLDMSDIAKSIKEFAGVPGRIERLTPADTPFSVFSDYAHSPDALENILLALIGSKNEDQKLTVVFGCGGDRDRTKRPKMGKIATELADFAIITSDNSRSEEPMDIINEILTGVEKDNYKVICSRREAIAYAVENAQEGEIILIAGKGHENYEITKDGKHPFDEKGEVFKAIAKRNS
ncbi:MAG: UDP-N-acetylmuramoyl-L-alanyl-D-glutamate--2,6-diaminopimelate ligase [Ruminococcaceae bacterium]|nr:UDP-N-acetylmuramoyl-L-alanyl-D-glutamate--2,6-diaminopimelate ligase [Oscillospiraceae bacterium]